MIKTKSVQDLWREFKKRNYGRDIGNISVTQLRESEQVFHMGVAAILVEMKENVSQLPDDIAVSTMEGYMDEIKNFLDHACEEYERMQK
jgi:hypothetical protein